MSDPSMSSVPTSADAERVISMIDLTDLSDDRSAAGIDALVDIAVRYGTAAVCVWPEYVADCVARRGDAGIQVATVVNFPSGGDAVDEVCQLARQVLGDGADEVDLVMPYRAFMSGDLALCEQMIHDVRDVVHGADRHLKVILETGELDGDATVRGAADLAIRCGADFIKTSTGKTPVGATVEAVETMVDAIADTVDRGGATVGIKPSGGIRTVADAVELLDVAERRLGAGWATPTTFRFGASSLLDDALRVVAAD